MGRGVGLFVCVLGALSITPATAAAGPSCVYDADTRTATLDLRVGFPAPSDRDWRAHRLEAEQGGELRWSSWGSYGQNIMDAPCDGARVENTDAVDIIGNDTGHETLYFGSFAGTGIVFHADLAGSPDPRIGDWIDVDTAPLADTVIVGATGIALDAIGTLVTLDSELRGIRVSGNDGGDTISGQGGFGTGPPADIPLRFHGGKGRDHLTGGLADDRLDGDQGTDVLDGDAGDDWLLGEAGADVLTGGYGRDTMDGGGRGDTFYARDGEADAIDGGDGHDRAQIDQGLDDVENVEEFF